MAKEYGEAVYVELGQDIERFGVRIHGAGEYPLKLRDVAYPVELLYFRCWWDRVESRSVAVVGTRKPFGDGLRRTRQIMRNLVKDDTQAGSSSIPLAVGLPVKSAYELYPCRRPRGRSIVARRSVGD